MIGRKISKTVDMVVLATGMVPNGINNNINIEGLLYDDFGFAYTNSEENNGFSIVGCVKKPTDVADCIKMATGASVECIQATEEV